MASRAFTARLRTICSRRNGSISTGQRLSARVVDGYVLSYRALEQAVHVGDSVIQVDYLRPEGLLAGEGKKLAGQSAGHHRRRSDHFQLLASALIFGPLVLEKKLQLAADDGEK